MNQSQAVCSSFGTSKKCLKFTFVTHTSLEPLGAVSPRPKETQEFWSANNVVFSYFERCGQSRKNKKVQLPHNIKNNFTAFACLDQTECCASITKTKHMFFLHLLKNDWCSVQSKKIIHLQQNQKIRSKLQTRNKNQTKVQVLQTSTISKIHCWWPKSCK